MEKSFTDSVNGNLRKVESAILVEIDRLNMVQNDLIKLREFVLNKFTKLTSIKNIFDQKFDDLNEKAKYLKEQNDQNKSDGDASNIRQKIQSVADELHQDVLRRLQTYVRILDKNVEETINYKINNIMKDKQATA